MGASGGFIPIWASGSAVWELVEASLGSYTHYAISYRELVHVAGGLLEAIWKL